VLPLRGAENMDDDIAVIEQQPAGVQRALLVVRLDFLPFEAFTDLVLDGAELSLAFPAADDEVVAKTAQLADIQQDDVAGLLIAGRFRGPAGYFQCFQTEFLRFLFPA
jgi:hypothetical protein